MCMAQRAMTCCCCPTAGLEDDEPPSTTAACSPCPLCLLAALVPMPVLSIFFCPFVSAAAPFLILIKHHNTNTNTTTNTQPEPGGQSIRSPHPTPE